MAFGFVEDGKVIRKGYGDMADRVIGEVNSTAEEAIAYFEERFTKLEKEVNEIAEKIETQANKGSFLTKVEFLKSSIKEYDGIGDFEDLEKKLATMLEGLNLYIEQNRHKNLQIKTALLEQLKPITESHEWKTASAQVKEVQQKWIKTGAVAEEHKAKVEGQFKELIDGFYKRRDEFYADLNKMMEEKESDFEDFVKSAEDLLKETDLNKLRAAIKAKQSEWKALGKIKPSRHTHFWNQFQDVIKKAFAQAKAKEKKIAGGNAKEQLAQLESFFSKVKEANEELIPNATVKDIQDNWKVLQKIKHKEAFELKNDIRFQVDMISEKSFIVNLAQKKSKGQKEDLKLYQKVCRDLLERDRRELINFEENMSKFNMAEGLDNMLTRKLRQQQQKVEVKKAILEQVREKMR